MKKSATFATVLTGIVFGGFAFAEDAYIQSAIVANAKVEPASGQAISTGYCPGPTTRVEVDCEPMDLTTLQQRPFGVRNGNVAFEIYVNGLKNYAYNCHGSTAGNVSTGVPYRGGRQTMILDAPGKKMKVVLADGTVVVDKGITATTLTTRSDYPLALFADFAANNPTSVSQFGNFGAYKIYSFKIFENDELLHDFRPLLKGDRPGFRDDLTGKTIWQSNTYVVPLTSGGDIATAEDDAYIASDKSQVVNLRHHFTPTTKIEVDFAVTATNRTQDRIFGAAKAGTAEKPFANVAALYLDGDLNFSMSAGFGYDGTTWRAQSTGLTADLGRHTAVVDRPGNKLSFITAGVTNWTAAIASTAVCAADECEYPLGLFANMMSANGTTSSQQSAARVYGVRIWKGEALIHDYRPCVSGGIAGFVDKVDGAFVSDEGVTLAHGGKMIEKGPAYVQMRGTGFLDTGYLPGPKTRLETDFAVDEVTAQMRLFGTYSGVYILGYLSGDKNYSWCHSDVGDGNWSALPGVATRAKRLYVIDPVAKKAWISTAAGTNIVHTTRDFYKAASTKTATGSMYIGGVRGYGTGTGGKAKFYGFRIYDGDDGELKRDFRPYVDADGNVCMKEHCQNKLYYYYSTAQPLACGGDIERAPEAQGGSGAYVQSTQQQLVNTGVYAGKDSVVEVDFALVSHTGSQERILGADTAGTAFRFAVYCNGEVPGAGNFALGVGDDTANGMWYKYATSVAANLIRHRAVFDMPKRTLHFITGTTTNNTFTLQAGTTTTKTGTVPLGLFGAPKVADYSTYQWLAHARIYSLKISEGGEVKHYFLPYKKGATVGFKDVMAEGDVIVTDSIGAAPLTVGGCGWGEDNAAFYEEPQSTTLEVEGSVTLSAFAPGAIGYQWLRDGKPIAGATGMTYVVDWRKRVDSEQYSVVATFTDVDGGAIEKTSSAATVTFEKLGLFILVK